MRNIVGTKGAQLDCLIKQAATFSVRITIRDKLNAPINVTGFTFSGRIRKAWNSAVITESFNTAVVNGPLGIISMELSAAETALLVVGETEKEDESVYVWDFEMTDTLGKITPVFYGNVLVFRDI